MDVTNIMSPSEVDIKVELPNGIEFAEENPELKAQVEVTAYATKMLTYSPSEILIEGGKSNLNYTISDSQQVVVTLWDSTDIINPLGKNNIKVHVEVGSLQASDVAQLVPVLITSESETTEITVAPESVNITVTAKEE